MLQTLKCHKHTTWSVYKSFLFVYLQRLFANRAFQTDEIDLRRLQQVTLHSLLSEKCIEMNVSRKRVN